MLTITFFASKANEFFGLQGDRVDYERTRIDNENNNGFK